jgi:hypothetical protein
LQDICIGFVVLTGGRFQQLSYRVSPIEGYNTDASRPPGEKGHSVIVTATRRVHTLEPRD